jgi:hypothetical protein
VNGGRGHKPPHPPLQEVAIDLLAAEIARGVRDLLGGLNDSGAIIDGFIEGDVALVITTDTIHAFNLEESTHLGSHTDAT